MKYDKAMNKAEQRALLRKYRQNPYGATSYLQFRRRCRYNFLMGCYMMEWCGMWLGIEKNGHTHS